MGTKLIRTLTLLLALFAGAVLLGCGAENAAPGESEPEPSSSSPLVVHLLLPTGEESLQVLPGQPFTLPQPAALQNYTFLGWRCEDGSLVAPQTMTVEEESYFSAVFSVSLETETHPPYLFPDQEGMIRPGDALTRGEAVQMLHALLSLQPRGHGNYSDVPWTSPYRDAAASMKSLGFYPGDQLKPDKAVSYGELLELLAHFFPAASEDYTFGDVREIEKYYSACCVAAEQGWIESGETVKLQLHRNVTRLQAALLMNRVLGRSADPRALKTVYPAFPDMPEDRESKLAILEAAVGHHFISGASGETWLESMLPPDPIPGFTSGDAELDELLKAVLDQVITEDMDQVEKLSALYDYVVKHTLYLKGPIYEVGDTSFVVEQAKKTLSTGCGNCYGYAAALYELYRAVGFDAIIYSGQASNRPHSWVEGDIDGVRYIFDPELQLGNDLGMVDLFMKTYEETARWCYDRGEDKH